MENILHDLEEPDLESRVKVQELFSLLIEYSLVFLEQIMYHRGVYPKESFRQVQSFHMAVYSTRHPGVRNYLDTLGQKLMSLLLAGKLSRVIIDVCSRRLRTGLSVLEQDKSFQSVGTQDHLYDKKKIESYGISFADSAIIGILKDNHGDLNSVVLGEEITLAVIYGELRSSLHSLTTQLLELPAADSDIPPVFDVLMATESNNGNDNFTEMVLDDQWVLAGRLGSSTNEETPTVWKSIREADIGIINIKGYISVL
ncbi:unnamed protein product [Kuraishia capsulata CBS 1993]|uniref:HORMA domain-containing protein n=1 Tax=Kuraishia capsulata CBS 1993 TaxID=1382522 RepID=W6MQ57_9ASCO|nr:uncharacterized protein KUCA_T00004451001 [Kuraishia capsulata CBS 1993]CDK28468.1 unnamed protein product [Kuraishia capsulata CBS 1993]